MKELEKINTSQSWSEISVSLNKNLNTVSIQGGNLEGTGSPYKGIYRTTQDLNNTYPSLSRKAGWFAYVGNTGTTLSLYYIGEDGGEWICDDESVKYSQEVPLTDYIEMEVLERIKNLVFPTISVPYLSEDLQEGTLNFIEGKLETSGTYDIITNYSTKAKTTVTWSSGYLQKSGNFTLTVCTLDASGNSRGMKNPVYLDFRGGLLVGVR